MSSDRFESETICEDSAKTSMTKVSSEIEKKERELLGIVRKREKKERQRAAKVAFETTGNNHPKNRKLRALLTWCSYC